MFDPIAEMEADAEQQPLSPEEAQLVWYAEQLLIARCMAKQGFEYPVTPLDELAPDPPMYLSPSELRRSGYQYDWVGAAEGHVALNGPEGPPDPTEGMSEPEQEAYASALAPTPNPGERPPMTGERSEGWVTFEHPGGGGATVAPTKGCGAEAKKQLYGSVLNSLRYGWALERLEDDGLGDDLRAVDAYKKPLEDWQACMRKTGYDLGKTTDYGLRYLQRRGVAALEKNGMAQTDVTAELIEDVANRDADCQESSGLYEVRKDLVPKVKDQVAAKSGIKLNQYIAYQNAILKRAEEVL